ncbi:uncharacterized protein LOC122319687 [Drosophila yakuba]|uniref:uncharacterized protein LOC122319687 n=1 Tax=Drosophila yakuba TaxID=7245 RepID=UPI001C8935BC|nr:uncharacterized protein LOC122319687 [Drosophila yakuba]
MCGKREDERRKGGRPALEVQVQPTVNLPPKPPTIKPIVESNKIVIKNSNKLRYLPAEERMQKYLEVRNRIFANQQIDGMRSVSRRLLKARSRFRRRHQTRRAVVEAVRRGMGGDPRVFAEVRIHGKPISGLLDTGASINVLGKGSREMLEELGVRMDKYTSIVRTAAGEDRSLIGRVHVPVEFKGVEKVLTFYVCPYLEQELYLGIDFWRKFALAPAILGEIPATKPKANVEELWDATNPWLDGKAGKESVIEEWNLQEEDKNRLEAVKKEFLAFEDVGLGKTSVETHRIQLVEGAEPFKDRHYPQSPAMQEIVWAEVDKMLELGVIEVSESPWSNRTTVVRRPDKNRFCLDARKLNNLTVKDAYPLPCIEGILSRIEQTYYISSVDLKFAFWQVELDPESRPYTAFTVAGHFVASHYGVGAVLFQYDEEKNERPIAFFSAKLNKHQINYSVTEKECLAAVLAIEKFRPYVELMQFTVITDHASLKWLMTMKDLSGRLARWSLRLQSFDFQIAHRKGSENVVADTLSRCVEELKLDADDALGFATTEFESEEYKEIRDEILENQDRLPDVRVEGNLVFKRSGFDRLEEEVEGGSWKLWIPAPLTAGLIATAHDEPTSGHGGVRKTLQRLQRQYYGPQMTTQVRDFVGQCIQCKELKAPNYRTQVGIGQEVVTERPFQKLYIDFLGKYPRSKRGKAWIFVVADHFSKFTFLKAMNEATTSNVIEFLVQEVFFKFGVP